MTNLKTRFAAAASGLAILFALPACAQQGLPSPVAPVQVAAKEAGINSPALWKVADEDTTIYLFGTVHALPDGVDWYTGDIADALASSDILITEVMMTPESAAQVQQLVMAKGMLPADQTLRGLLNAEQTASYEAALAKMGMPAETFDRFEPWYAGMMMAILPLMKEGYSADAGVEKTLESAAGAVKARGELETMDFQLSMFDQLPQDAQIKFLIEATDGIDQIKPMLDAMVAEWLEGDADELARLMNEGMDDAVLAETLLYSRNASWAAWIDERLDAPGTVFIAVGAGHLAGEKSVQDLLARRGIPNVRIQ